MHSPNEPDPESRERILAVTLSRVAQRRRRRQRRRAACRAATAAIALASVGAPLLQHKLTPATSANPVTASLAIPQGAASQFAPAVASTITVAAPSPVIERVGTRSRHSIVTVHTMPAMEYVGSDKSIRERFERLTDEELLASLPARQAAGLVRQPDGSAKLVFLK